MSPLTFGVILSLLFYALLLLFLVGFALLIPKSLLGGSAKTVIKWLPPFLGGKALREWAAKAAEQLAKKRLAGKRSGETASQLAAEMEEAAMHAMLPLADPEDLERIVPCPETGQGRVGVTAPEALDIAGHIRKHKSRATQKQIYEMAVKNAKEIASPIAGEKPFPCALQGSDDVCCVFSHRPLRCRPLHAITIAKEMDGDDAPPACSHAEEPGEPGHEQNVAQGIEAGVTRALESAGLDAKIYELNSAVATALETSGAAERWARGEDVFRNTLRIDINAV